MTFIIRDGAGREEPDFQEVPLLVVFPREVQALKTTDAKTIFPMRFAPVTRRLHEDDIIYEKPNQKTSI